MKSSDILKAGEIWLQIELTDYVTIAPNLKEAKNFVSAISADAFFQLNDDKNFKIC